MTDRTQGRSWRTSFEAPPEALEPRQLPAAMAGPVAAGLTATLDPADDPLGDGTVLAARVDLTGTATPGAVVRVTNAAGGRALAACRAAASGHYHMTVAVPEGASTLRITAAGSSTSMTVDRTDVILAGNLRAIDAVRAVGMSPTMAARDLAILQLAVDDAVLATGGRRTGYAGTLTAPQGASTVAAAAAAVDHAGEALFPSYAPEFASGLAQALASVPGPLARAAGRRVGVAAADAMLALRADDGSATKVPYTPGTAPGDWVPTPPKYLPALDPQFASVTPFELSSPGEFLPPPPPALDSAAYAANLAQVESLGSKTSTTRTPDQTALARFWSDLTGSSFTPPGHWNQIAEEAAGSAHMGLAREAQMFATLDVALADAGIACWNAKYTYNLWRPVTAIREAALDGNPATVADPTWTPLWSTPNFPSYVSGHSAFSGAAAEVLTAFFGDHHAFSDAGDPTLHLPARQFSSFEAAAEEAGFSRVVGGIHFEFDNIAGLTLGNQVAAVVLASGLKGPADSPAVRITRTLDGSHDLYRFGVSESGSVTSTSRPTSAPSGGPTSR